MDSTGLKVLLSVHQRAQLAGGRLVLAAPPRPVQRVVSITGLDEVFEMRETVADAVAACTETDPPTPL
jgi:anti-sigma B factor antagonist